MSVLTAPLTADEDAAIAAGKIIMCVLDDTGDARQMWDPNIPAEVEHARKSYDEAIAAGMRAFHVRKNGEPGRMITEFPAEAGKVIFAPALQGG